MRKSGSLVFATILLLTIPGAAAAQGVIKITPKIGGYFQSENIQEIDDGAREVQRTGSSSLALGANVEIGLPGSPIGIRGDVSLGTDASVTSEGVDGEIDATLLGVAADAVFRPLSFLPIIDPYGLVGAGFTNTSFDDDESSLLPGVNELPDEREFALHAGIGTDVALGGARVQAEVTDYIAGLVSDSETGHNVFFTVGLGFDLF